MRLHQIKIAFVAEQDRLLLAVSTDDGKEVLLYLTRRYVRKLWTVLLDMARSSPDVAVQGSPEARAALLGFQHEQAVSQADFSRPYEQAARERPLGSEPILAARIQARKDDSGNHILSLLPLEGTGVTLTLDDRLLHSFCKLLQNAVAHAEWDFTLSLPQALASAASEGEARTIN